MFNNNIYLEVDGIRYEGFTDIAVNSAMENFSSSFSFTTTVKETKTAVTESMRGMASKAVGIAPEKKPILEVNDQFARWQILAGIKRN